MNGRWLSPGQAILQAPRRRLEDVSHWSQRTLVLLRQMPRTCEMAFSCLG